MPTLKMRQTNEYKCIKNHMNKKYCNKLHFVKHWILIYDDTCQYIPLGF